MSSSNYTILITSNPSTGTGHHTAINLCRALLAAGHTVQSVFFYSDAVLVANKLITTHAKTPSLLSQWQQLAKEHNLPLQICVGASLRRGICDATLAQEEGFETDNLAEHFEVSGLGTLAELTNSSTKLLRFGS
jgi:tRNA 2-thiouridine synthesizing protein D